MRGLGAGRDTRGMVKQERGQMRVERGKRRISARKAICRSGWLRSNVDTRRRGRRSRSRGQGSILRLRDILTLGRRRHRRRRQMPAAMVVTEEQLLRRRHHQPTWPPPSNEHAKLRVGWSRLGMALALQDHRHHRHQATVTNDIASSATPYTPHLLCGITLTPSSSNYQAYAQLQATPTSPA